MKWWIYQPWIVGTAAKAFAEESVLINTTGPSKSDDVRSTWLITNSHPHQREQAAGFVIRHHEWWGWGSWWHTCALVTPSCRLPSLSTTFALLLDTSSSIIIIPFLDAATARDFEEDDDEGDECNDTRKDDDGCTTNSTSNTSSCIIKDDLVIIIHLIKSQVRLPVWGSNDISLTNHAFQDYYDSNDRITPPQRHNVERIWL